MLNLPSHQKKLLFLLSPVVLLAGILWFVEQSRPVAIPISHTVDAPIALSSDGRFVASYGSSVDRIQIFDHQTGEVRTIVAQPFAGTLLFAPNNKTLVVGGHSENASEFGYPSIVQLWDVTTSTLQDTIAPMKGAAVALSPDGHTLATGNVSAIDLWSFPDGKRLGKLTGIFSPPQSLNFSSDGKRLNGGGVVYDMITRKQLCEAQLPANLSSFSTLSSVLSPDGQVMTLGSYSGKVAFFDGTTGKFLREGVMPSTDSTFASNPPDTCRFMAFSPDSRLLASGGWGGVAVWNVADGKLKESFPGTGVPAFSEDGKSLYAGVDITSHQPLRDSSEVVQWRQF